MTAQPSDFDVVTAAERAAGCRSPLLDLERRAAGLRAGTIEPVTEPERRAAREGRWEREHPCAPPVLDAGGPDPRDDPAFEVGEVTADDMLAGEVELREGLAAPELERVGLGYRMRFPAAGVVLIVERLRDSRGELSGELSVRHTQAGHLYRGRFNLSSLTARVSAARFLAARTRVDGIDWPDLLERCCLAVLDAQRSGEPVERVGRRPALAVPPRLVDPIVPTGVTTIVYAPHSTGKSTLLAALAVGLETGAEIVPGWRFRPTRCLVLDWEAHAQEWNDRLVAIAAGAGVEPPDVLYLRCHRPFPEMLEEVSALVTAEGVGCLMLDSVGLAGGQAREGGDAAETTERLFGALGMLPTTNILADHVAGADLGASGPTKPYGSVMKLARARAAYELRREADPVDGRAELVLRCEKLNDGPKLTAIGLAVVYGAGTIRFDRATVEAPELVARLSQADRMARFLRDGGRTEAAIAAELNVPPSSVRTVLARSKGRFLRLTDGRIGLAR